MSIYATRIVIGDESPIFDTPGRVRHYLASHQYQPGDPVEHGIDTAHVPDFCVPGHTDEDNEEVGEWLRLSVGDLSVLIDSDAARELGQDLTAWAALPKVSPR